MKIDKIPPMFDNLHGNVHNELGPTKRAGKDKFVKNKKNYCNEKGECTAITCLGTTSECKYSDIDYLVCNHHGGVMYRSKCKCEAARKEAGVK